MRISKVTTKTGDKGKTSLGDGTRVFKDHPNINFLGDVDELNTHLGHAISSCDSKIIRNQLKSIQQDLFNIGGESSMPNEEISLLKDDRIVTKPMIAKIESVMSLKFFIINDLS